MARSSVGYEAIVRDIDKMRRTFDLRRDGLGRLLCAIAADGVMDNMKDEKTPDGQSWAPLSQDYQAWKAKQFPGQPMAVLHHLMADPAEVRGELELHEDDATMTYGVTEQARQEAAWFIEGDARQPPRDFWGLTKEAIQLIDETLDHRFQTAF